MIPATAVGIYIYIRFIRKLQKYNKSNKTNVIRCLGTGTEN